MQAAISSSTGARTLAEMQEFASFPAATQRYIQEALAIRFGIGTVESHRDGSSSEDLTTEARLGFYACVDQIAALIPADDDLGAVATLMRGLVPLTAFDIAHTAIGSFAAYRFLYERLIGAAVRPWLAGAFLTAVALEQLHPHHRRRLLGSIDAQGIGAHGWSIREPAFYPQALADVDA